MGDNNIGIKKCTTTFLWVLNLGQVGGRQKNFQNLTTGMIFLKMVSNLSILRLKFGFKNKLKDQQVGVKFFQNPFPRG